MLLSNIHDIQLNELAILKYNLFEMMEEGYTILIEWYLTDSGQLKVKYDKHVTEWNDYMYQPVY